MELVPSINIDGITFRLLNKYIQRDGYLIVNLISNEHDYFSCYRSNSELGMWRLCSKTIGGMLYKGSDLENYDYVQTTLIHILLQIFININIGNISSADNDTFANCILQITDYKRIIDAPERIASIYPFNQFHSHLACGQQLEKDQRYKTILDAFSKIISEHFKFIVDTFLPLSNYSYTFERMQVTGKICHVTLDGLQGQGTIELYFLICKLCDIGGHYEAIRRVCDMKYHIMPIALIPSGTTINKLGLYTNYIIAGAYICKLFDYYRGNYDQCDEIEKKTGICSDKYAYIGERYINVYPYNELILLTVFNQIYDEIFHEETEFKQHLIITQEREKQSEAMEQSRNRQSRKAAAHERLATVHKRVTDAQERAEVERKRVTDAQEQSTDAPKQEYKKRRGDDDDDGLFNIMKTPRYVTNLLSFGFSKGINKNKSKKYKRQPRRTLEKTRRRTLEKTRRRRRTLEKTRRKINNFKKSV